MKTLGQYVAEQIEANGFEGCQTRTDVESVVYGFYQEEFEKYGLEEFEDDYTLPELLAEIIDEVVWELDIEGEQQ
jgi:hypothetical protein